MALITVALAVCVMGVKSSMVSRWSWAAVRLFVIISAIGYVLPFLFLTLECSAFTKITNEVQLDHYVHMQRNSETFQAQAIKA